MPAGRDSWARGRWAAAGGKPAARGNGRGGTAEGAGALPGLEGGALQRWASASSSTGKPVQRWGMPPEIMRRWGFAGLSLAEERSQGSRV